MQRDPAVAGKFYSANPQSLLDEVQSHVEKQPEKVPVIGVVSPHAGFMYSGDVAGAVYSRIEIPDTLVILGPNHTGKGKPVSLMAEGTWSMPFGQAPIDTELAQEILKASPLIHDDSSAHLYEHSLETQLPFIQYFRKNFYFVPVCLKRLSLHDCERISQALFTAVERVGRPVLIVASSDMTHFESHASASRKDRQCIDQILKRDAQGLYETVRQNEISMCGVNPVTVMLLYSNLRGAKDCSLVKYMTSGEVSGDMDRVVGYAGLIIR
ncbi:MAG: AmmeMemoRadiSam system protein B [Nitrospinota bacterium]|nr:AmmeMemoRadiSam system protein B [Nitrospinota bacterium]